MTGAALRVAALVLPLAVAPASALAAPAFADRAVPDIQVVDQAGVARHFVSELAGDRVVVVSFMYTTCRTLCPITNSLLAALDDRLGADAAPGVRIISVTIDPVTDDAAALAASAEAFGAGADWYFVGGEEVPRLTRAFGMQPADIAFHEPVIFVGRADLARFTPVSGFPTPDQLLRVISAARDLQ